MREFMDWVLTRLREPSTYAGLSGLVSTMAFWPEAPVAAKIIIGLGSVAAVVIPEVK